VGTLGLSVETRLSRTYYQRDSLPAYPIARFEHELAKLSPPSSLSPFYSDAIARARAILSRTAIFLSYLKAIQMSKFNVAGLSFSFADLTWVAVAVAAIGVTAYLFTRMPIG